MSTRMLAALALCVGLIAPAHGEDKITLRYGEIANSARGISTLGIHIAQRKGFLEREGIDFKVVGLRGTSFQVAALDNGEVEVANTAMPYLIQAVLKGSNSPGPPSTLPSVKVSRNNPSEVPSCGVMVEM